ncbi:MAG TPA: GDSL-type esterase/lipase family protein [Chthonomonadaceae bacterium]|nr:GDSL-type esterase/lipase family protein [Chthonomonadaceae bacterium]
MRKSIYLLALALLAANGCGGGGASQSTGSPSEQTTTLTRVVAVNDPNWFFSPDNWFRSGANFAETAQPGAYFKIGFTGTQIALRVDPAVSLQQSTYSRPIIRWQIDGDPPQDHLLQPEDHSIRFNVTPLAAGQHTLSVWYVACDGNTFTLRIQGLEMDAGGKTSLPPLRAKRILFLGDSLAEGVRTEPPSPLAQHGNDSTHAYPYSCASVLDAECGVIGIAGQGWTLYPSPLDALNTIAKRNVGASTPGPDYVVVMEGANDAFAAANPGNVATAVQYWLIAARSLFPASRLCMVVEFGGFERAAVTKGFQAYQTTAHDAHAALIDLGPAAQQGLTGFTAGGTLQSYDGVHPNARTSEALGTQLAAAIQAAVP